MMNTNEKLKVLITEDDESTRLLLRASITQWGYEVVEAADGEIAWQMLNQDNPPQILLLDWLIPKIDGIALCERINKELTFTRPYIIFLTNLSSESNALRGIEAGADAFMAKPFNVSELRTRLNAAARTIKHNEMLLKDCIVNRQILQKMQETMNDLAQHENYRSDPQFKVLKELMDKIKS